MDWNSVEEQIALDDQNKWDRKISGSQLLISLAGKLRVPACEDTADVYSLSELAIAQLCHKLEIPVRYYRRLPDEMKALVANFDLKRHNEHSFFLRGKGQWIRAFLSGDYIAYNNAEIAETAQNLLTDTGLVMKDFVLEETNFFLKIISEELVDRGSGLKAGIMIGNSEVGMGSVSVEPFVFRKPCTNDLIVAQEKSFKHAHIHLTAYELTRRMATAISDGFRVASSILDRFLKARDQPIEDPVEVIRRLAEERVLSQKFTDESVSSYLAEPERNLFGVINAFTSAAQGLAPLQRIEMERFAGTLL